MLFTWQMAQELAAGHMRAIGFSDARRTRDGADRGLDFVSARAAAEVNIYAQPVDAPDVQRLRGADFEFEGALFCSGSGETVPAFSVVEEIGVALFAYNSANEVTPSNDAARDLLPRRRWRSSRSGNWPRVALVANAVIRVPASQAVRSIRSVNSAPHAPSRTHWSLKGG